MRGGEYGCRPHRRHCSAATIRRDLQKQDRPTRVNSSLISCLSIRICNPGSSRLELDMRNFSLGRRHLCNAYEVKGGVGVIAGKTV